MYIDVKIRLFRQVLDTPPGAVDCSVVVVAFLRFVIASEITRMSHLPSPREMIWPILRDIEISSLARNRGTQLAHSYGIKAWKFRLI